MKINIKDNNQWIADETKKRKRRIKTIIILFVAMAAVVGGSILYSNHCIKTGKIYPLITLADAPGTEQPVVQTTKGYEKVVKTPTLPFTMTVKGDVVTEGETFCTILIDGDYITICEVPAAAVTKTYLKDALIPVLGVQPVSSTTFNEQRGYLNNRYIETEADTVMVGEKKALYCMSYRIILGGGTDIMIVGISSDTQMDELHSKIQNVFYSMYQLAGTEMNLPSGTDIDNISTNPADTSEYPGTEVDMDADYVINGSEPINPKQHQNHIYEIDENTLYKSNEEKIVTVDTEMEEAVFVFSYQIKVELRDIKLYDPEGNEYLFDNYTEYPTPMYAFHVNNPMLGDWKFVYTVPDQYIGNYRGQVVTKENYDSSMASTNFGPRDNDN